jgi:sarcosine oxidase, subunit gamma
VTGDALRRSPLTAHADALASIRAAEVPFLPQWSLRVDPSLAPLAVPAQPNTWLTDGEREILWLGPDEWLVVGGFADELSSLLGGIHHSLIDVSSNRVAVELRSADRFERLSTGCGLDLHPRSWRAGMCAQTLLARVAVLLQEHEGMTRLFVRPSFAGYLVTWFERSRPAT